MDRRDFVKIGAFTLVATAIASGDEIPNTIYKGVSGPVEVTLYYDPQGGYGAIVATSDDHADACIVTVFYEAEIDIDGRLTPLLLSETATSPVAKGVNMMMGPFRMRSSAPKVKRIEVELVRSVSKQRFDVKQS